ncbi:MAG: tRNA lysidine(34) synthetase TilS [Myxococcales bacterium]|nr:tRNA lysidine(34) synthetase TilS [Myxococcales bacterium]
MKNDPTEEDRFLADFERRIALGFRGLGRVLVAVSGGSDSMALAEAAFRVKASFEVASLDHGLRAESAAEVQLVRAWAQKRGVPFHTRSLGLATGPGVEARARDARYSALLELANTQGFGAVATAHTATDQAETVVMRLTRGAAGRGAAGIHAQRGDRVVRPLLFATRADTDRYVAVRGLVAVADPMNDDVSFLRVRVRREVLPALERAVGPHAVPALARFAHYAAEDDAWLQSEALRGLERARLGGGGSRLDLLAVRAMGAPIRRRALAAWLSEQGVPLDAHHLDDALTAIAEGRTATLPGDRVLLVERSHLSIGVAPARLHGTSSSDDGRPPK